MLCGREREEERNGGERRRKEWGREREKLSRVERKIDDRGRRCRLSAAANDLLAVLGSLRLVFFFGLHAASLLRAPEAELELRWWRLLAERKK